MLLHPLRIDIASLEASPFPLDMTLVKDHVAVDGDDSDAQLEIYARAAIAWAEGTTRRTIYARSHTWVLRDFAFHGRQEIRLPRGKTRSVESVAYSQNGSIVTLTGPSSGSPAGTDYQEDLRGDDGGIVMPARGQCWPSVDCDVPAPVAISFTAGWLAAEVPADVIHALLFAVEDAFDTRGSADLAGGGRNFVTREALISPYRLKRWY